MVAPGDLLQNRYRVLRPLGAGGFGQVFEVEEDGVRKVLKVLDLGAFRPAQQPKVTALFHREVDVLSQFEHPGVPRIEPDGYFVLARPQQPPLYCLVMEQIVGLNLQEWLQQGGVLSQAQAIDWLKQLVFILDYLHQRQFFHRDIKPANIMLRSTGQLVLIDFGAVREITATYLAKQQRQHTGTAIISAGYTPPEQAEGHAVPQSDFFALGRTFVYLLTGKDPIDLPKDDQTGQLIWRDRPLHDTKIAPPLADLLDRLMAPFPGQRPQSCAAIAAALQTLERQLFLQRWIPLIVWLDRLRQRFSSQSAASDRRKSRRWLSVATASVVLAGVNVWMQRGAISGMLNDAGLDAADSQQEMAWGYYQLALLFAPRNPHVQFNLGNLYEDWQQFDRAKTAYRSAIAGEEKLWQALNNLARLEILAGNYQSAIPLLEQGLQQSDADRYVLLKNLGWAQLGMRQYDRAEAALRQAIELEPEQGQPYCLLAITLKSKVNNSDASTAFDQCIEYADGNNPDDRVLLDLARGVFPQEVQP